MYKYLCTPASLKQSVCVSAFVFMWLFVPISSLLQARSDSVPCFQVAKCVEIGLPMLILLVIFSQVISTIVYWFTLVHWSWSYTGVMHECFYWLLQYLVHLIKPGKNIFDRFAVVFTVAIVWIYAHLLTVGGAYNDKAPKTQTSCRTDRAGLIDAAPW